MKAWHFLREDGCLQYPPHTKVEVGQELAFDGEPKLCEQGFHASKRLIDALGYAPGPILCRVELSGEMVKGNNKVCAQRRKVLWMQDISTLLHEFACDEAERALNARRDAGDEPDPRSYRAIEVKRLWLKGEATDTELDVARVAARKDVAWVAARDAAWDAAWDVADWDAARAAQNRRLTAQVTALMRRTK